MAPKRPPLRLSLNLLLVLRELCDNLDDEDEAAVDVGRTRTALILLPPAGLLRLEEVLGCRRDLCRCDTGGDDRTDLAVAPLFCLACGGDAAVFLPPALGFTFGLAFAFIFPREAARPVHVDTLELIFVATPAATVAAAARAAEPVAEVGRGILLRPLCAASLTMDFCCSAETTGMVTPSPLQIITMA